MKTVYLTYDRVRRTLSASDDRAGSVVDNGVTTLHVDPIQGCTMDLVFGIVLRTESGKSLKGHPFSRLDAKGDAVLYSDVLRACTGGALPVALRLTYDNGTVESSEPCILKVYYSPDADVSTQVQYSDLAMTRNSSMSWVGAWTYERGAVVTHNGAIWVARAESVGEEPNIASTAWKAISTEPEKLSALEGIRGNVQDQLDGKNEKITTFSVTIPGPSWTETEEGWVNTVQHVGFHEGHEVRVTWTRESYLDCWTADVRVLSVSDGKAVVIATSKPIANTVLTIEEWKE
jgi:hypothetical protein